MRSVVGRIVLLGPTFGAARSIAVNLGATGSLEAFANELADWIETPALSSHRAEQAWPAAARAIVADLADGMFEEIPA